MTYDVFISHASEDKTFAEKLAKRLKDRGVIPWLDTLELKAGDHLFHRLNEALENSQKIIAIFSRAYFDPNKKGWTVAEAASQIHPDILVKNQRRLIPLILEDCNIPPLLQSLISIDFRRSDDFDLKFQSLIEALDVQSPSDTYQQQFREHDLSEQLPQKKQHRFQQTVKALYELVGYTAHNHPNNPESFIATANSFGGMETTKRVICKENQIVSHDFVGLMNEQKKATSQPLIIVSTKGFDSDVLPLLTEKQITCLTYKELLYDLFPLDLYAKKLIEQYENQVVQKWDSKDCYIRPTIETDILYEKQPALNYFAQWMDDTKSPFLVILGDLGTGKTTLSEFLTYHLARSFMDDPVRHPAPVMIPLKEVRKEISLEGIIISHFSRHNMPDIQFKRFEHLLNLGKIILFFDAFDEMADRVQWQITKSNFNELRRASENGGKVILTCRTHYFKDRTEQVKLIGEGPKLSAIETALYKDLKDQGGAAVVYLQEFSEDQIADYVQKVRPKSFKTDLIKIKKIHNLKELAHRPLLLDMIVKSLPKIQQSDVITAANLYETFTNIWIEREESKGRFLDKKIKSSLMLHLAWKMWNKDKKVMHYKELSPFLKSFAKAKTWDEDELRSIYRELMTATFLKRDDDGQFSFMHRSFLEFFLAKRLYLAFKMNKAIKKCLNTTRFDRKVIFFLYLLDQQSCVSPSLQGILTAPYEKNISENALQILYWLARFECDMEDTISDVKKMQTLTGRLFPSKMQLTKASLQEINLEAADLKQADLSLADLSQANLINAIIKKANLKNAILKEAKLDQTGLDQPNLKKGRLKPVVQLGHSSWVYSVCYNRKYNLLASGSGSGILLFDVQNKIVINQLDLHQGDVGSVDFSPDGQSLASGSSDKTVRLWNVKNGESIHVLKGHQSSIRSVDFSPDGQSLASGSSDNTVRLWDVKNGESIHVLKGHQDDVNSVDFSPDGQSLASGSDDKTVRLWDVKNGASIHVLKGHQDYVRSVGFSPDGQSLASGSWDKTVRLWNVRNGESIHVLKGHQKSINSVDFSPDGQSLASGSYDETVRLWDVKNGESIHVLKGHQDDVRAVDFSPDGQSLASGSSDNTVRLWDVKNGESIHVLKGHQNSVYSVDFSPDGQSLASGSSDQTVRLWDVKNGESIHVLKGHQYSVSSVDFSPDGQSLASGSDDHTVRLWDVKKGESIHVLKGHQYSVTSVDFSPDGQSLASGSYDKTVRLWDVKNGESIHVLKGHQSSVRSVDFSPDGQSLASGSDDKTVRLWDVKNGESIHVLKGHQYSVTSVDFSPDGQSLASGSNDNTVRLWDVKKGECLHVLQGHWGSVYSVKFSTNGKYLIAAGAAGRIQFWDPFKGITFLYRYNFGPGAWLDLMPDGRFNASPEGTRYLRYTELGTFNSYPAEDLIDEFYQPGAVKAVLLGYMDG
jgi:WD40 repeat protein